MTRKIFFVVVAPHYFHPLAKAQVNVVRILEEWEEYIDKSENLTKLSLHLQSRRHSIALQGRIASHARHDGTQQCYQLVRFRALPA